MGVNITNEGNLATDLWTYIYDIRSIELSEEEVWVVGRIIYTYFTYLGIKDATRKRRIPNNTPG